MRVEEKGGTSQIKDTAESVEDFLKKVTHEYKTFANQNIIIDLLHNPTISIADVESFQELSDAHRESKKSFIVVAKDIDYNAVSDAIQVVPTILEAHDIIEIEEIERDLGF